MKLTTPESFAATVAVTRFNESDDQVILCLSSLLVQKFVKLEVLFLDQNPSLKIKLFCRTHSSSKISLIYRQLAPKSLSYARNFALSHSVYNYLLFLDCDATAASDWAYRLLCVFQEKSAAIVGGRIVPDWSGPPPFFVRSSIIREQYSLLDLGLAIFPVSRIIGCNFGVDKRQLNKLIFTTQLGRKNGRLLGGEETEMCDQIRQLGYQVYYSGRALVTHHISANRLTLSWIVRRMYYAGMSRAIRKGLPRPISSHRNGYDYLMSPLFLPPYLIGFISNLCH